MRIVHVAVGNVRMPPKEGGAPLQVIFNTSVQMARRGHEVMILDRKYSRDDPPIERVQGVEIVRLKAVQIPVGRLPGPVRFALAEANAIAFAMAASKYLRKNGMILDVVHLHLTSTGLLVAMLNRGLRGKMVYTCHLSQWALPRDRLHVSERTHLWLDAFLMRRVRKVIALSETAKRSFISHGRVEAASVAVMPNGVDTKFFRRNMEAREALRTQHGLEGRITVLFVGRLAKIKGVEHLLQAADIVINEYGHKDAVFVLVGPHEYAGVDKPVDMREMLRYMEDRHLSQNVMIAGPLKLEAISTWYAASDLFVLPSLAEGDPLVTLEAMASGLPVIGTRVGGIPNQVIDGWNGFLIPPGDERQLAEKIRYLLDNPDERTRMSLNARRRAEEEFDWSKAAERLLLVYQS